MRCAVSAVLLITVVQAPAEAPRAPRQLPFAVTAPLAHVSAAHEIGGGRVLVTNAKGPSLLLLDPGGGTASPIGAAGGGAARYAVPGGLYGGPDGTTLMIDRGQTRLFTITPSGDIAGSRSIARKGVTSSSDADIDQQRVDSSGRTYFVDRMRPGLSLGARELPLVQLIPETQVEREITRIRQPEMKTIQGGDNVTIGRVVVGSPADGWGVAPDGRVAVVRAQPYRVEWHDPRGAVTQGPVVDYTPLPMTDADKRQIAAARSAGGVSIGQAGAPRTSRGASDMLFAPVKPAFEPDDVLVSPDARVWVMRTQPIDAGTVVYDVFDAAGKRTDRIALPTGSRIVGFGPAAIYVRLIDAAGRCDLRKYVR